MRYVIAHNNVAAKNQKISAIVERLLSTIQSAVDPDISSQECAMQNPSCSLFCSPGMPQTGRKASRSRLG